ncbi:NTP transferase domain-containing protein [candidate division KSB1 bacterium]|nr:NTP transferase domain-containing protein [candidate division KSB1 bacterium]
MIKTAFILAAGYGKRLHPMTLSTPKALVPILHRPLLDWILTRLDDQGIERFYINSHHLSDMLQTYIQSSRFADRCTIVHEPNILETGGGIKNMVQQANIDESVLVHNCDIFSTVNLREVYEHHRKQNNQATLVVMRRQSSRYLIFDSDLYLCGRGLPGTESKSEWVRDCPYPQYLAFNGIQIIEPLLFKTYPKEKFSSIELFLAAANKDQPVRGYLMKEGYYKDAGKPETLKKIKEDIRKGLYK